jgi:hypothetical protein
VLEPVLLLDACQYLLANLFLHYGNLISGRKETG